MHSRVVYSKFEVFNVRSCLTPVELPSELSSKKSRTPNSERLARADSAAEQRSGHKLYDKVQTRVK